VVGFFLGLGWVFLHYPLKGGRGESITYSLLQIYKLTRCITSSTDVKTHTEWSLTDESFHTEAMRYLQINKEKKKKRKTN